jgi:transcriptional regulator with XRE-family HTH domain
MLLNVWMIKTKTGDEALAEKIGVDRVTINRLRRGIHLPSWETMLLLSKATKKEVMPNDFLETAAAIKS